MESHAARIERVYPERYVDFRNALATVTGDRDSARDAVREGSARALRSGRAFRGDGPIEAWVWKICLRSALELRGRADPRDDSDWLDVRRRARRAARRRALAVVAAAAAAALLLAAPAFGLHRVVVSFFESEPAPERVQLDFARQELGAPKGMAPGAIPNETRKVVVPTAGGGRTFVWVAPTRSGGFCVRWKVPAGGCRSRAVGGQIGAAWMGRSEDLTFVYGAVISDDAARLELRYEDGTATDVPLAWVSPPIDAGFYFAKIPPRHLADGARPSELVLYDDGGDVLATEKGPVMDPLTEEDPTTGVPRVVRYDERQLLHSFTTENGRTIELYEAPSRRAGTCAWLESRGKLYRAFFGCRVGAGSTPTIGAGLSGGADSVLLSGMVSDDVARLELRFQDGGRIEVPAVEGFVVAELPRRHWTPGHRLELIVAFDASGTEVGRKPWDPPREASIRARGRTRSTSDWG